MLNLARPYTFPHLVDDARRAKVVYIICQLLHGNPAMIPTGWEGAFPVSPPVDFDSPLSAPDQERLQLHAATDFLGIVATGLDARIVQDLGIFYRGYEKPLFHATHSAAARIDTRHGGYQTLCQVVSSTYDFAGVDRSRLNPRVLASVGPDRDTQTEDPEKDGNSMPGVTRAYLSQLARARTCSGPNCTKTIYEEGRPFPVCSRCKTVRYCGPECQKRDWSSAQAPHRHKDICPLLRQLLAEANPTMTNEQWAKAFVHTLDIEAQWKLFEWAIDGPLFSEESKRRMKQFLQRMVSMVRRLCMSK
ncbi:hypothetical protein EXIGLDRAFT_274915 [Exidia glandulosa HHB12029]|uniref:MYND-type domain-containing protein n=1 Tax=Exidia glandulosa HHB12029 TaxID=1314781 RepID=A0A166B8D7_EXIGL|nr:hypothetical protein EXIGLDRAFT_274915 [Exidia glandulosa HHB12029]